MMSNELMDKQASGRINKIKLAATISGGLALICLVGMVFSRRPTLKRSEGEIVSQSSKVTSMRSRRSKLFFSTTTFRLKGISKKFVVRESGDGSIFTDHVQLGDTVTFYSKTWVQLLSGCFGTGNTFRVEKNGAVLFDDIKELRGRGVFFLIASTITALFGLIFYRMEIRKTRRLQDLQDWRAGVGIKK